MYIYIYIYPKREPRKPAKGKDLEAMAAPLLETCKARHPGHGGGMADHERELSQQFFGFTG